MPSRARVLLADHPQRPALSDGRPPEGEEVLLDQNADGRRPRLLRRRRHRGLARGRPAGVCRRPRGRRALRRARAPSIATGESLDDAVRATGGSLAWSLDGRHLFYTRVDDAWRPYQVWRHELGSPVEQDALVHEEADERFFVGVGSSRDDRHVIIAIGSKTTLGVPPARRGRPPRHAPDRRRAPARGGVRHRADRRPAARHAQRRPHQLRARHRADHVHVRAGVGAARPHHRGRVRHRRRGIRRLHRHLAAP